MVDHAALVALERLELDRVLVGHHRAQLAHEVARVGAQPLEFRGDVVEVGDELARPGVDPLGFDRQGDQRVEQLRQLRALERSDPLGQAVDLERRALGDLAGRGDVVGEALALELTRGRRARAVLIAVDGAPAAQRVEVALERLSRVIPDREVLP